MDSWTYEQLCDRAEWATANNKKLKLPKYKANLELDFDGLYSYKTKIADIDMHMQTIKRLGWWSRTSSKHYNYTVRLLKEKWAFEETL